MSNIQTGAERMPHDLSHLGFLAGQDRKSGSAGMPRPIAYAVFCWKNKTVVAGAAAARRSAAGAYAVAGAEAARSATVDASVVIAGVARLSAVESRGRALAR